MRCPRSSNPRAALRVLLAALAASCALLLSAWLAEQPAFAQTASRHVVFLQPSAAAHPSFESVLDAARGPLAELGVELLVAVRPSSTELGATTRGAGALARSTHALAVVWLDSEQSG